MMCEYKKIMLYFKKNVFVTRKFYLIKVIDVLKRKVTKA